MVWTLVFVFKLYGLNLLTCGMYLLICRVDVFKVVLLLVIIFGCRQVDVNCFFKSSVGLALTIRCCSWSVVFLLQALRFSGVCFLNHAMFLLGLAGISCRDVFVCLWCWCLVQIEWDIRCNMHMFVLYVFWKFGVWFWFYLVSMQRNDFFIWVCNFVFFHFWRILNIYCVCGSLCLFFVLVILFVFLIFVSCQLSHVEPVCESTRR